MDFLRKHWYDVAGLLAILSAIYLWYSFSDLTSYGVIMWLSLISLFLHQLEEYRVVGTFPGMANKVLFRSSQPDRYPLNSHTALLVNVVTGWLTYGLAVFFGEVTVWLGIATMIISAGNFLAHTFLFNIRGKTFFNAGMATSILFFLPVVIYFFVHLSRDTALASPVDWWIGVPLGIFLNYVGIIKMIDWFKDERTRFVFEPRQVP
ncbi:MAG: HXXEE domain-containing protein [Bacteroidota bacterium]